MRPICFLTDFGSDDAYAGICRAVMERIASGVTVIDLTHGIAPQAVRAGAVALHDAAPFLPKDAVVCAVVDPGVGSARRAIAVRGGDRRFYVGPDNGLLLLAAERVGPLFDAVELADPRYRLDPVSATFHGRDVFAPAAAHLSSGVPLSELGPAIDPSLLERIALPAPTIGPGALATEVLVTDRYGNAQLACTPADLAAAGLANAQRVEVQAASDAALDLPAAPEAVLARTFADAPAGSLLLHEDSTGHLALAVAGGSAAALLGLADGVAVTLAAPRRR